MINRALAYQIAGATVIVDQCGATCHKVTLPKYSGRFSVWIDKNGKIFDAEQKLEFSVRDVNRDKHHILWNKLQDWVNRYVGKNQK